MDAQTKRLVKTAASNWYKFAKCNPLSKEETIRRLRRMRLEVMTPPRRYFSKPEFTLRSYTRSMIVKLIHKISTTDEDPIELIYKELYALSDIVEGSEHRITWTFCSYMDRAIRDILLELND